MFLTTVGVLLGALAIFVLWRYTSVARGAKSRDEALFRQLDPLAGKLEQKAPVSAADIQSVARVPQLRPMLHAMLGHYGRLDLFPSEYLSTQAQAESALAYWMLHPNELQAPPARIEPLETLRRVVRGKEGEFFVFRYRMAQGHWAGAGWILGLAGPFYPDEKAYGSVAGGFSRANDAAGKVSPTELVDWYVGVLKRKFGG